MRGLIFFIVIIFPIKVWSAIATPLTSDKFFQLAEELFNEAFEAIPADRILSDGKDAFIARYEANISAEAAKVKKAKAAVDTLTADFEAQVKANEKIIATYTEFLTKLA